ncbi:MAG: hypothetical protein GY853_00800 [PVC group bacterium]|nr:hypothetical protein [PVC group bacterium]
MFGILIIGLIMSGLSVWFWYLEAQPFISRIKTINDRVNRVTALFHYICAVTMNLALFARYGLSLVIDVLITLVLVTQLSFGGLLGSIIGLSISNGISLIILTARRRKT